jgi:gas vesicle protein
MVVDVECRNRMATAGMSMFFLGLLAGAAAGGIAALLLAPKSGRETREMIKGRANETQQRIQSQVNNVKDKVGQIRNNMRSRAEQEAQKVEESK